MIQKKLSDLNGRIETICKRFNRDPNDIRLVLVTKGVDTETILEAYQLGIRDFGENRVQEWLKKKDHLPNDIRWHLVGHLQTNKVKYCIGRINLIHSLDSVKLALAIEEEAAKKNTEVDCLIQVNVTGEVTKYGIREEEVESFASEILKLPRIRLSGLMTIGPMTSDVSQIRSAFRKLKEIREHLRNRFPKANWNYLSIGMSSDYEIALEEGANVLRIGTAVFGERLPT